MLKELKRAVYEANMLLPKMHLVTFTWGNVSGIDRQKGYVVIKPSGVEYENLKPKDMAVLTAYAVRREKDETLGDYLKNRVFAGAEGSTVEPKAEDVAGFNAYIRQFKAVLPAEKAAVAGLVSK